MVFIDYLIWLVISLLIVGFSAIIHECAHAWVAYKLGDDTAYYLGRITLNPLKHIDPVMTIILPIGLFILSNGTFAFGGAKPVPINPYNFRNPDKGMMLSSLAGPLSNLILAIIGFGLFFISAILLKQYVIASGLLLFVLRFFLFFIIINIMLALFNLIPIPPLDGSRILRYFLPWDMKQGLDNIEPFGFIIIMVLLSVGGFGFLNLILNKIQFLLIQIVTK